MTRCSLLPPPPPPPGLYTHIDTTCVFSAVVHEYTRVCVAIATFACSSTVLLHATHTSISMHTKYTLLYRRLSKGGVHFYLHTMATISNPVVHTGRGKEEGTCKSWLAGQERAGCAA